MCSLCHRDWRYFKREEFDCHDGTRVPCMLMPKLDVLIREILDPLRALWSRPLKVVSGFRTDAYNRSVGGALRSNHRWAMAADIQPEEQKYVVELYRLAIHANKRGQIKLGGIGLYQTWIHVDIAQAEDGHLRKWYGKGVGSERVD